MTTTQTYSVVMADDHILLRDALAGLINTFEEFSVAAVAGNGKEVVDIFTHIQVPQLLILDLNMPEMDGYDTAQWVQKNYPDTKILILTMYDSEIALIRLLQVGVKGFLKKDIHPLELKTALLSVMNDGYYYSHATTGKLASLLHKTHATHSSIEKSLLNEIEIEFLKLASTDMTYKEIALAMKMTPRSIDGYRDGLFEKLDVKSRVGLAIYAVRNGIVTF